MRLQATTRLRSGCGALEIARDDFVGLRHSLRAVPCAAIRVDHRISRVGKRAVYCAAFLRLGRPVDRRSNEGMPERHRTVQRQQAFQPTACAAV